MSNNNLTDSEIKKALEEYYQQRDSGYSDYLAYGGKQDENEESFLYFLRDLIDLINRLQAENERLNYARTRDAQRYEQKISDQAHTNCVLIDLHSNAIKEVKELEEKLKTAKAEAYKECMARVEDRLSRRLDPESFPYIRDILHEELEKLVGGNNAET